MNVTSLLTPSVSGFHMEINAQKTLWNKENTNVLMPSLSLPHLYRTKVEWQDFQVWNQSFWSSYAESTGDRHDGYGSRHISGHNCRLNNDTIIFFIIVICSLGNWTWTLDDKKQSWILMSFTTSTKWTFYSYYKILAVNFFLYIGYIDRANSNQNFAKWK